MNRRLFLITSSIFFSNIFISSCVYEDEGAMSIEEDDGAMSIEEQRQRVRDTNLNAKIGDKISWSLSRIVNHLTRGLPRHKGRKKLFEFIQSFPYEIVYYDSTKTSLFDKERGDCRHKRVLLYYLLQEYKERVRMVDVVFNWADLPVSRDILNLLKTGGTKGLHSCLEVMIDGKWVYIEPSWDIGLETAGFPIVKNWDGNSPTIGITIGETTVVYPPYDRGEHYLDNLLKDHGIRYKLSETKEFVKRLNKYLREVRTSSKEYDKPLPSLLSRT